MARYVLTRILRALISIFIVVSLVVVIVFTLVPETRSFIGDQGYQKMKGNAKTVYYYSKLETLGYLDYVSSNQITTGSAVPQGKDMSTDEVISALEDDGYTVLELPEEPDYGGGTIAYRYYNPFQLVANFYKRLIVIDTTDYIQDPNNPDLERGYRIERDYNGIPALVGSGTLHKYMIYVDSHFPFIHQNFITLDFGESFPTHGGVSTLDVISTGQGNLKNIEQKFPTGITASSPIDQHTLKYKFEPDHLDQQRFTDNYADGQMRHEAPSMIGTSYIFGVASLLLQYAIAIPFAVAMARRHGGIIDKIGIIYINLLISIPSLAFIFFMKYIGFAFGLPDRFPNLGFADIRSYIMPILVLALMGTPSLMMWLRRYMVDQSTADYVKFATAKGLTSKEISRRHVLKNAIIPIVNGIPGSVILAISGAVITESVFSIPGMGKMLPDAVKAGNNNMVITLTFIFTTLAIFSVLLGDLLMTKVDPRISLAAKKKGGQ